MSMAASVVSGEGEMAATVVNPPGRAAETARSITSSRSSRVRESPSPAWAFTTSPVIKPVSRRKSI